VSRTHRQGKEMWCYARDEGGPLEAGSQVQASAAINEAQNVDRNHSSEVMRTAHS
jgi:hypothetical protein